MVVSGHGDLPLETWREGVRTQMLMSALLGSRQLCIFEQFCDPGLGSRHGIARYAGQSRNTGTICPH